MQRFGLLAILLNTWKSLPRILGLLFNRSAPLKSKALIILALLYLFIPYDLIPEWLLGYGVIDDVLVVTTLLNLAERMAGLSDGK